MKQKNTIALILILFVLSFVLFNASPALTAGTPVVSPGANLTAVNVGAVRYRALKTTSDKEVFLGIPDLGVGANRTQLDLTWGGSNDFTFVYNAANDKLTTSVTNSVGSWTLDYPNFSTQVANLKYGGDTAAAEAVLSALNYMQFTISLRGTGGADMQLQNLTLDGNALGSYDAVHGSSASWMITDYDFSSGFTLTGTLALTGSFPSSAEVNKIDIQFGHADTEPPSVTNVLALPNPVGFGKNVTVTALASDSLTGNSVITSAEFTYDDGTTWYPMSALDGLFDEPMEDVTAIFSAPTVINDYDLCVRARDAGGSLSAESCTTLSVVDDEGPTSSSVNADPNPVNFGQNLVITALIDDTSDGGSDILSAEYSWDAGENWYLMEAADGNFDSPSEPVTASTTAPLISGDYTLCVAGTDNAGNLGSESCITLTVNDNQGPEVFDVQATPNPVDFGQSVSLTASISDQDTGGSNVSKAEFTVDGGTTWLPMDPQDELFDSVSEDISASFTAPQTAGNYDLCVRGEDTIPNVGSENCITLEVADLQGPTASAVNANHNPVGFGESLSLTASIDDSASGGSNIDAAEYSLDGGTSWYALLPDDGTFDSPVEAVSADFSAPSAAGEYDLCVHGIDSTGNTGAESCLTLTVTDNQGPLTSAVLLTPNLASFGAQVVLTATVDDTTTGESPIANAEYSQDGGTNWLPLEAVDGTFDTAGEEVTASFTASNTPGTFSICVRATDEATNLGTSVCVDLQVKDTQGPVTSDLLLNPNPALAGELITLTAQVSDATTGGSKIVSAQYSLNNGTSWLPQPSQDGSFNSVTELVTVSFTAPDQPGNFTICVRGKDAAGKTGAKTCVILQVGDEPKMMKVWFFPIINRTIP